jgi:hypothetical protein
MHSKDFLLRDTNELELGIERHCMALGLDTSDPYQVHVLAHELMQEMARLKREAAAGDAAAQLKLEIYSMVMMLHDANLKAFGSGYISQFEKLSQEEPAWTALARALWSELKRGDAVDVNGKQ